LAIQAYFKKTVELLNVFKKRKILKISDYLDLENITFLKSTKRKDVILELVNLLYNSKKINDSDLFYKKIIERENVVSTAIGMGVAIPHAKLNQFNDFFIAIGIKKKCRIYWSPNSFVRLVFLIGGPEIRPNAYLQLLSKLTIALKKDSFRRKLLQANSEEAVFDQFCQI